VPIVGSSFYSEQSVRKTRIISLSDVSGRAHFFLQRNTRAEGFRWKPGDGLIALDVRCAPKGTLPTPMAAILAIRGQERSSYPLNLNRQSGSRLFRMSYFAQTSHG